MSLSETQKRELFDGLYCTYVTSMDTAGWQDGRMVRRNPCCTPGLDSGSIILIASVWQTSSSRDAPGLAAQFSFQNNDS